MSQPMQELVSILALLVHRNGGTMTVKNIDEMKGQEIGLIVNIHGDDAELKIAHSEMEVVEAVANSARPKMEEAMSENPSEYKTNPFGNQVQIIQSRVPKLDMLRLLSAAYQGVVALPDDAVLTNNRLRTEEICEWLSLLVGFNPNQVEKDWANGEIARMLEEVGHGK